MTNFIFLSYFLKDKYSSGGVTALANDVILKGDFRIVAMNPSDCETVFSVQKRLIHNELNGVVMKCLYWTLLIIKLLEYFLRLERDKLGACISCNIASSIMLSFFAPQKLIIWENIDYLKSRKIFNIIRIRFAMMRGAHLILTSKAEYDLFRERPWAKQNVSYIKNWTPPVTSRAGKERIVSVGFLEKRKGFDLLLKYIDSDTFENLPLEIYGDGEQKEELIELIRKRKLTGVTLSGYTNNAYVQIEESIGFLMPSRFEGSPLTLIHALKCGIPVAISTKISDAATIKKDLPNQVFLLELNDREAFMKQLNSFKEFALKYAKQSMAYNKVDRQQTQSIAQILSLVDARSKN